jgi:hypothetical protein
VGLLVVKSAECDHGNVPRWLQSALEMFERGRCKQSLARTWYSMTPQHRDQALHKSRKAWMLEKPKAGALHGLYLCRLLGRTKVQWRNPMQNLLEFLRLENTFGVRDDGVCVFSDFKICLSECSHDHLQ